MTFTVFRASDWNFKETRTFSTLDELKDFQIAQDCSLVINFKELEITIYDDYLE